MRSTAPPRRVTRKKRRVDLGAAALRSCTWALRSRRCVLAFLVGYILVNGVPYLTPSLFEWEYTSDNVSLMPALVNTLLMAALSLLMAVPVGVGSAIYLVEYAPRGSRFVQVVRTTTETLQGIPSIIYGLFGMLFFVTALHWNLSLLAGACTLAIMVLPVIMRTTEEALLAVPDAYREGGFGLGAGRLRTVFRCVLPSAVPGISGRRDSRARALRGRGGGAHLHGGLHCADPECRLKGRARCSTPPARSPCTCTCWPARACM